MIRHCSSSIGGGGSKASAAAATPTTVRRALKELTAKFSAAAVPEPVLSAEHLLAKVLCTRSVSYVKLVSASDLQLDAGQLSELERLSHCRLARMPLQYVVGDWDFRDLASLKMRPPVFIPRPETEQLVSLVLDCLDGGYDEEERRVLEVGCGSGAVCISLLKANPRLTVTALDQSQMACDLTRENARKQLEDGDAAANLTVLKRKVVDERLEDVADGSVDLVVSNPPYVLRKDLMALEPEITL